MHALRVGAAHGVEAAGDALEEVLPLDLQAVEGRAGGHAGPGAGAVHLQKQGDVRRQVPDGRCVYLTYQILAEFTPVGLIGDAGVQKPITNHNFARFERRFDDLAHVLGAGGGVQQRLAPGSRVSTTS